jgi:uncharacterized protein YqjF (DUF2071 family)
MAQTWDQLLFAHWPVSADQLRRVVPPQFELDTFADQAWLGVVAFQISRIHLHGLPAAPGLAQFPEVNLRTYVRHDGRPGVLFLSLHCPNRFAMAIARPWFRLPYHYADVCLAPAAGAIDFASHSPAGASDFASRGPAGAIDFASHGPAGASFAARYCSASEACAAPPESLDTWLTERYCYFTVAPDGRVYRCDIDHAPWMLAPAEAEIHTNTLPRPFRLELPQTPPLLHCAERVDARIWPLRRVA